MFCKIHGVFINGQAAAKMDLEHMRTEKIQTRFAVCLHKKDIVENIGLIAKILTRRVQPKLVWGFAMLICPKGSFVSLKEEIWNR